MEWVPQKYRTLAILGGAAVSAFSGKLPDSIQFYGLIAGLAVMALAIIGTALHFVNGWRKGRRMTPETLLIAGLIGLTVFGGVTLGGLFWKFHGSQSPAASNETPGGVQVISLSRIMGRDFKSEEVRIDGNEFVQCSFENVTLLYDGGHFSMINVTFKNPGIQLRSKMPSVRGSMILLNAMQGGKAITIKDEKATK